MPLPEISVGTTDCTVPLGDDPGTLDPGRHEVLHLRDIAHSRWEELQANAATQLEGLGMVLDAMMTGRVDEFGDEQPKWTRVECIEVTTTWPYRQIHPIAEAVDALHNGPQVDSPLGSTEIVAMAQQAALETMASLSGSLTPEA